MSTTKIARTRLLMGEAVEYTGLSAKTLRRRVADGTLPAYRIGPRLLSFEIADLDALFQPIPTVGAR